jgi:hypothetical protein
MINIKKLKRTEEKDFFKTQINFVNQSFKKILNF